MANKRVVLSSHGKFNIQETGESQVNTEEYEVRYTRDILQAMSDKDLISAEKTIERTISSVRRSKGKAYSYEVELCYIQDELFRRASMKAAAESYASNRRR